jgi:hypothetical protein
MLRRVNRHCKGFFNAPALLSKLGCGAFGDNFGKHSLAHQTVQPVLDKTVIQATKEASLTLCCDGCFSDLFGSGHFDFLKRPRAMC